MFNEEKCPKCSSGDYEVLDFFEDGTDSGYMREWYCACSNCHERFTITYYYTLSQIIVEGE